MGYTTEFTEIERLTKEGERLRAALAVADQSIRHHLRSSAVSAAMIQPHAVRAIRDALEQGAGDGK